MALTYATYVAQLANLMATDANNPSFTVFLPGCIDYAEQHIYRELDLLYTQVTDSTASLTASNRNFTLPITTGTFSGVFITVDQVNVITPAGTSAALGTRQQLLPVSREAMDVMWPASSANTGLPQYFSMRDSTAIIVGPSPNAAYVVEVIGIQRPTPLSASNTSTFLTQYVPDLFIAASMVFAAGFMRNFGAQADDPKMSQSWENQYQALKSSAAVEQFRAKWESSGWSSQTPTPLASRE